jgi:site-specific DNA recombinase
VRNILTQAAYVGQTYYNRTQRNYEIIGRTKLVGRGKRRWSGRSLRPKSEWIPIVVPAIIAVSEWEAAQERLITNRKFAGRNNKKHFYLLRSLLVCQTCGRTLIGRTRQNGYTTYACCYRPGRISPDIPKHTCTIAAEIVEPIVWQAVCELLCQPEKMKLAWEREKMGHVHDKADEPDQISHRMSKLKKQQERLLDLYQDGQLEKDTFVERKERIEQEYQALQQQQQGLTKQAEMAAIQQKAIGDLAAYAQRIQENLDDPSPELQQEVIRLLIDHISIGEQEIVIKHIVPDLENGCLSLQRKNRTRKPGVGSDPKNDLSPPRSAEKCVGPSTI